MLVAMRAPLEALTAPERLAAASGAAAGPDARAEAAAAAEALAGLVASGAPWVAGEAEGGWALAVLARALRGTGLDLADCWAAAARWGGRERGAAALR
jgi:hypothetical protein